MSEITLFLLGAAGAPLLVFGVWAWRQSRRESGLRPGSRRSRAQGCVCPRGRNWRGLREALRGSAVVTRGCPVFEHHPEVRRRMYKGEE